MTTVPTFTASVYVGFKDRDTGRSGSLDQARKWLQAHVNDVGLCVTLTPTEFIYTDGGEPGFIVGLINYPRFPDTPEKLKWKALAIAKGLLTLFHQYRVSVVFPTETVMLSREGEE